MKKKPSVKILVGYHKPAVLLKDDILTPIHLGRALATKASKDGAMSEEDYQWMLDNMIGDDTGDNISQLNREFCEVTAMYWAWKNYDKLGNPDYIGFMHYRRHFIFNENFSSEKLWEGCYEYDILDDNYIKNCGLDSASIRKYLAEQECDMFTTPYVSSNLSVENQHRDLLPFLNIDDLLLSKKITEDLYPEYKEDINLYFSSNKHYWYHSFIMKKEVFFQYCEWLFPILLKLHTEINYTNYSVMRKRAIGFISERLHGVFITHLFAENYKKIKYIPFAKVHKTDFPKTVFPAFNKNNTALCFSTDQIYILYTGVAIKSIIEHSDSSKNYDIIILVDNVCQREKDKIKALIKDKTNFSIRFLDIEIYIKQLNKKELFICHHFQPIVYYRLFLHNVLQKYKKVLYLDSDIIVKKDIAELFNIDLKENIIGAAKDIEVIRSYQNNKETENYINHILKLKNPYNYFNSGVLLLNLEEMRKRNIQQIFQNLLNKLHMPKMPDQDILNVALQNNVEFFSENWNFEYHIPLVSVNCPYDIPAQYMEKYQKAKENPYIIHYTGPSKPWFTPMHLYSGEWWLYARMTPFYEEILFNNLTARQNNNNIDFRIVKNIIDLPKDKLKLIRYKLLSKICLGNKRKKYRQKTKIL
ncbi:MAG: DUF4422 domain-containing protein, partial [Pseudomonadota bacterium]|nr:DUF4422 domain-containing protein [Pseudomonadota bacterium]